VLRPLAEGRRQWLHGRTGSRRVPPRLGRAGAVSGRLAGRMDRRVGVAADGSPGARAPSRGGRGTACRAAARRRTGGACRRALSPPVWRVIEDVMDGSVTVETSEFGETTLPDGRATLYRSEERRVGKGW